MNIQPLLTGLPTCRDHVPSAVADSFGLMGDRFCGNTLGCYHPATRSYMGRYFADVDGLRFEDVKLTRPLMVPDDLPLVIHAIPADRQLPFPTDLLGSTVALRMADMSGLRSGHQEVLQSLRAQRQICNSTLILGHQEGGDVDLERLYQHTLTPTFFRRLLSLSPIVLVAPGYSVYDDVMCEWLQLFNMARMFHFVHRANKAGVSCIPTLGWSRHRGKDLHRIAEWLNLQGDYVTHLAVNAQTGGVENWRALSRGMAMIEELTGRSYQWLVFGGIDAWVTLAEQLRPNRLTHVESRLLQTTLAGRSVANDIRNIKPSLALLESNRDELEHRKQTALASSKPSLLYLDSEPIGVSRARVA